MCMVWPCNSFVDGLSYKCINVYMYKKRKKLLKLINPDGLHISMLLHIMLAYLMLLYPMLLACIMLFFH